ATTEDISGLTAGTYTVTVTDANGCSDEATFTIDEPEVLVIDTDATVATDAGCNAESTGSIDLLVSGGTEPYTYAWSNGEATEDLSGLSASTYTVTVTDANGCSDEATFSIDEPEVLVIDTDATVVADAGCNADANGSIDLMVSGGTELYTYAWSNGVTTEDISGLTAGTYTVTVTDASGCSDEATFTINEPEVLVIDTDATVVTDAGCNAEATGSIDLMVSGGTEPYTYAWSNGATTEDISGLSAGTYTVTVTDANGCSDEATFTIDEPEVLVINLDATAIDDVTCNGDATGSINLVVSGGTEPYTYVWSNGETTEDISGLPAGTYDVTVTDANGCTETGSFTIEEASDLVIDLAATIVTDVDCNGDATGSIDLVVNGGTPAYTYVWSNGATTEDLSGLPAGTYDVTVTDANGCTETASFTIDEATDLVVEVDGTVVHNVACNGDASGSIDLLVSGGTPAYTYAWSNGATTEDLSGLPAGTYSVTVTDSKGCTETASYTINEANDLVIDLDAIILTAVDCNGDATGAIDLVVDGGTPAYTYAWSNGATTEDISDLTAGTYDVTVTDANGCTETGSFTIEEASELVIDLDATVVTDVDCNGDASGSIDLVVTGGTMPYTYAWSNGETTETISSLTTGTYDVTVTDANGCTETGSFNIEEAGDLVIDLDATTVTNVECHSEPTGSIDLVVNGGTPPYTFAWSLGETTEDINGLYAGTYDVFVTDANGCTETAVFIIEEPSELLIDLDASTITNVGCNGDETGAIDLVVSGGTPGYTYAWSNGATTESISELTAGTYDVTVTDANGCEKTASISIDQAGDLVVDLTATLITDVACNGDATGAIDLVVSGGTPAYTYIWSNGETTEDISDLVAGTYDVTVTDANGCSETASFNIEEASDLVIDLNATAITNVDCNGDATGVIDLVVSGGTPAYTFVWSNGATTEDINGLAAGTYDVTVTDANGCTKAASFIIEEASDLVINLATTVITDVACNGDATGAIDLAVNGGTGPYTFAWSNGAITEDINGLTAGTYDVTVMDAGGCSETASFTIEEAEDLLIDLTATVITDIACNGDATGTIDLVVNGGTQPYTFAWSNGEATEDISGLIAGAYAVTVTDANGCTETAIFTIEEAGELMVSITADATSVCEGDAAELTANVSGGQPAYTYEWSTGDTEAMISVIPAVTTTYELTVTDANGCTKVASIEIIVNELPDITVFTASGTTAVCQDNDPVILLATPSGGIFEGTGVDGNQFDPTGLDAGDYEITYTYTDANDCTATGSLTISVLTIPEIEFSIDADFCLEDGATQLVATPAGGTFSGPGVSPSGLFLPAQAGAGTHDITYAFTNAGNCSASLTVSVVVHPQPQIEITEVVNASCKGSDGSITIEVTEGTPEYDIVWSTGASGQHLNNVSAGTYSVTVTDANGCTATAEVVLATECFDLALTKRASGANPTEIFPGDLVVFTLELTNQGNIAAENIEITDYVPNELVLEDPNWSLGGSLATRTIPGPLAGGATISVSISFRVADDYPGGTIVNYAEISAAENDLNIDDIDSNFDQVNGNDGGGLVGSPADDYINGDGTGAPNTGDADGDEDDHDPAQIQVLIPCDIAINLIRTICDPNGTNSNPNDDVWTIEFEVTGQGTGGTWNGTVGGLEINGNYNEVITAGPFAISNGAVNLLIIDADDPDCTDLITIEPPQTCSEECDIRLTQPQTPYCDDNGTDFDPDDDVYYVVLQASGFNLDPDGWTATDNFGNSWEGDYNVPFTFGPYSFEDGAVTITYSDAGDGGCQEVRTINPPDSRCSEACRIEVRVENIICDQNGTPYDNSDDQFIAIVTVSGSNEGSFWRSNDASTPTGQYGVSTIMGPFPISKGNVQLSFRDNADSQCSASVLLPAPDGGCSDECLIDAIVTNIVCDNMGTLDPSDDTYSFDVTVLGEHNYGDCWNQKEFGFIKATGDYGVPFTFGPYLASEGPVKLTFRDCTDDGCTVTVNVEPPVGCSADVCEIDNVIVNNIECTDANNGTFTFDLFVDGHNVGGTWAAVSDAYSFTGSYGNTQTSVALPANGQLYTFEIIDASSPSCRTTVEVRAPKKDECATCQLTDAQVSNIQCTDTNNGTFTFDLLVNGQNVGGSWAAVNGIFSFTGSYGKTKTSVALPANGQVYTFQIIDTADPTCRTTIEVQAPSADECATCELANAFVSNIACSAGFDGTFTFDLTVDGNNTGNSWTATGGGISFTGDYGAAVSSPALPADGQKITFTVTDNDDPSCTRMVDVTAPSEETCAPCSLTAEISKVICDDSGEQFFIFDILVNGNNAGAGWTASANGLSFSGVYGQTVTSPSFVAQGEVLNLTITDDDDPSCSIVQTIEIPYCGECNMIVEIGTVNCDDAGTLGDNDDDTFNFTLTVTNGTSSSWVSIDGKYSGFYGQPKLISGIPISQGAINIQILDKANPNCQAAVFVNAPEPCSSVCTIDVADDGIEIVCNDLGTPADASDDVYNIAITATSDGAGTSLGYVAFMESTGLVLGTGFYGQPFVPALPFLVADGPMEIRLQDLIDKDCSTIITVDPSACQICGMAARATAITCDDNGTPGDVSDDVFFFDLTVDAAYASSGWTIEEAALSRNYGETVTLGPFPVIGGDVSLMIMDQEDPDCHTVLAVTAPPPCSDLLCEIGVEILSVDCDDMGTSDDAADDMYTATVILTNTSGSNGWSASNGAAGSYDVEVVLGPFPVADQEITFTDDNDNTCTTLVTFEPPLPEVICPIDVTGFGDGDGGFIDFICTDVDFIFNNPGSLVVTGEPVVVNACGLDYIDFSDEILDDGECAVITILRTFTIHTVTGVTFTCEQRIYVRKPNFDDVNLPVDRNFTCGTTIELDENGNPHPNVTGYPTVITVFDEYQLNPDYCNLAASYVDEVVGGCAETKVINRTWTITDECLPGETLVHVQVITIDGFGTATITCPVDNFTGTVTEDGVMIFETNPEDCGAIVGIPTPEVVINSDCGAESFDLVTEILNNTGEVVYTLQEGDSRILEDIGAGDYTIRYTVLGGCGPLASQDCYFRVEDQGAPEAVCVGSLNVSLGGFGIARIYAAQVDDGSFDACGGALSLEIRRMYTRDPETCDTLLTPYYSEWAPYIDLSCCDAGLDVVVELRVTDAGGNVGTCSLEILVEDKSLPFCTGLEDEFIHCDELPFGFSAYNPAMLAELFGVPQVIDNCSAEAIELDPVIDMDECGGGTITRRFQAIDKVGNVSAGIFEQVITIEYSADYEIGFPADAKTDCIDEFGLVLNKFGCDSVTVSYTDVRLNPVNGECARIMRTYHVINHCEWDGVAEPVVISRDEDCNGIEGDAAVWILSRSATDIFVDADRNENNLIPNSGSKGAECDGETNPAGYWRTVNSTGYWQYTQIIELYDDIDPEIDFEQAEPFCTTDVECEQEIVYPFTVTENCLAELLTFTIMLDANADGVVDAQLDPEQVLIGTYPNYGIRTTLPIGKHNLMVRVDDGCNNRSVAILPLEVIDCYVPEPNCFDGFTVDLEALPPGMDVDNDGTADDAAATVFASELASCNVFECAAPLRFSVNRIGESPDIDRTTLALTCKDGTLAELEVTVWDDASNPVAVQPDGSVGGPNYRTCRVRVRVADESGLCGDCQDPMMEGLITTQWFIAVEDVMVNLESEVMTGDNQTDVSGHYRFDNVIQGFTYTLRPEKDGDDTNGLSTLDLLLLRAHLLGITEITDPYQLIAADVNHSGSVTTLDMFLLRQLLLGEIDEFTSNTSWRFVDANYTFKDPTHPFEEDFPEYIQVDNLLDCYRDANFVAIKIGDINGSAVANRNDHGGARSPVGTFGLRIKDQEVVPGQIYRIDITSDELDRILGYQSTLNFNTDALELIDIEYGQAGAEHIGRRFTERGMIPMSWDHETLRPEDLSEMALMFSLTLKAKVNASLKQLIWIDSRYIASEAYGVNGEDMNVELRFDNQPGLGTIRPQLFQNYPNPFAKQTKIGFELPEDGQISLQIRDLTGKVYKIINGEFSAGYHEFVLNRENLPAGLLYYTIEANGYTATRKMIVMN
ncbi:MAG: T9SS type A sorting domain-containing protein, partial [Saprospiraceae bacterium]